MVFAPRLLPANHAADDTATFWRNRATIAATHSKLALPATAIVAIVVTAIVLLAVLVLTARLGGGGGRGGLKRQMVTSYMGLIVIAMGVQFALTGLKDFMAAGG